MFRPLVNISRLSKQIRPIIRNNTIGNTITRNITYFTNSHEFIDYNEKEKTAKLGITFYAKHSLGEILFIEKDYEIGDTIEVEDEVITLESTKATGVLSTPLEGEIIQYNDELIDDLDNYNNISVDKENEYWLVKLQLENNLNLNDLLCEEEYRNYIISLDTD